MSNYLEISASFEELNHNIELEVECLDCTLDVDVMNTIVIEIPGEPIGDVEIYEGDYVVTPKVEVQSLPTKNKFLQKDVSVRSIPYFETSNAAGGKTVYIGREVTIDGE